MDRLFPLITIATLFVAGQVGALLLRAIAERDWSVVNGLCAGIVLLLFGIWLYFATGLLDHFGLSLWFLLVVLLAFAAILGGLGAGLLAMARAMIRRAG